MEHLHRNVRSLFLPVEQIHNAQFHACQTKWPACTLHCNKLSVLQTWDDGLFSWDECRVPLNCFNISKVSVAVMPNFKENLMHMFSSLKSAIFWTCRNCRGNNTQSHFVKHYFTLTHARNLNFSANDSTDYTQFPPGGWNLYWLRYCILTDTPVPDHTSCKWKASLYHGSVNYPQ